MQVKSIKWLSVPAAEAEVEVTDGTFTCVAFSCPCEVQVGDAIREPLHIFGIKHPMLFNDVSPAISNLTSEGLGRRVIAELIDITEQILKVGGIILVVDECLPGGLQRGDFVEFECARIDLW